MLRRFKYQATVFFGNPFKNPSGDAKSTTFNIKTNESSCSLVKERLEERLTEKHGTPPDKIIIGPELADYARRPDAYEGDFIRVGAAVVPDTEEMRNMLEALKGRGIIEDA